jgi:hypothetical protein
MKESCIQHPPKAPLIIIREWQLDACGRNECAAALLSFFEYWHNIKLESRSQAEAINVSRQQHGDTEDQYTGLLQHHTEEELERGILLYKRKTIRKALPILYKKKFVTLRCNPFYKGDRTKWFLFQPDAVNRWIKRHTAKVPDGGSQKSAVPSSSRASGKNAGRSGKSAGPTGNSAVPSGHDAVSSMHETTSMTTSMKRQKISAQSADGRPSRAGRQSQSPEKGKRAYKSTGGQPEASEKAPNPYLNQPAIKILRSVFNFRVCPDVEQSQVICESIRAVEQQIGTDAALANWREVLEEWHFNKSSPVNFAGQLRKFAERIAFVTNSNTRNGEIDHAEPNSSVTKNVARFAEAEYIAGGGQH